MSAVARLSTKLYVACRGILIAFKVVCVQYLAAWAPRNSKLPKCCNLNLHQARCCKNLDGQA